MSRSRGRVRGTAVVLSVLSFGLLGGCAASKETREGADRLADLLGRPSWARSVDVETGRDGYRNKDYVQTTVDLGPSAGVADVAGFVADLPGRLGEAGFSDSFAYRRLRFVATGGGRLDLDWRIEPTPGLVTAGVDAWFEVAAAFSSVEATLRTDVGDHFRIDLGEGAPADAVGATYDALRRLDLAPASYDVLARDARPAGGLLTRLEADQPPTQQQLAQWRELVVAASRLPQELPASSVRLQLLAARAVADLVVLVPEDATAESLTVTAYGDRLWPGIRPFLAGTAGLPGPWTASVSWAPRGTPTAEAGLVSLLSDRAPVDAGDASSEWSRQAASYVAGLG